MISETARTKGIQLEFQKIPCGQKAGEWVLFLLFPILQ